MRLWHDTRLKMSLTRLGLEYIASMVIIGILAVNTGYNLLYIIFSLMLAFFVVSGVLSRNALRGITFDQVQEGPLFARSKGNLRITIKDNAPQRLRAMAMRIHLGDGSSSAVFFPGGQGLAEARISFAVRPMTRGPWKVQTLECQTSYPFGFLTKSYHLPVEREVSVFPHPKATTLVPELTEECQRPSNKRGSSSPEGTRPFKRGDSTTRIHWKRTAQRGSPWVRTFEGEENTGLNLRLDLNGWRPGPDLESELERLSGIILQAKIQKRPIALEVREGHVRQTYNGCTPCWKALAHAKGHGEVTQSD